VTPIATYQESWVNVRRRFELFADRVRVTGVATGQGKFDATIPLQGVRPEVARLWVHSALFYVAVAITGLAFVAFLVVALVADFVHGGTLPPRAAAWTGGGIFVGLVLALATHRQIELANFCSEAGLVVLQVGRAGKQAGEFDQFVAAIVERIKALRGPAAPG
jgi:hypothetical protein